MKKSKLLAILLCVVMLLVIFSACNNDSGTTPGSSAPPGSSTSGSTSSDSASPENSSAGSSQGSSRETVNIALASDGGTLSPAHASGDNQRICLLIQEPMFDMLDDGTVIYLLAESVDVLAEDHWTVHVREGVKFSNGNPLTASDIVFSIQLTRDSGIGTPRTNNADLTRTYAADDYTVELYWDAYHDAQWQGLSDVLIYDEESYSLERASSNPIGTGPYVVSEYMLNSHCNLVRRDDYWGELPPLKNINFMYMAETAQVINALETGRIDIGPVAAQDYEYATGLPGFVINKIYQANYLSVGFAMNVSSAFYNNKEARYAVAHCIDKQAILDLVFYGLGRIMYGPNTVQSINYTPDFDNVHSTYSIGYDLDLARQYAESSGLAGKEITILASSTPVQLAVSEMLMNMLSEINVSSKVDSYDGATIRQIMADPAATYDMTVMLGINPAMCYQGPIINGIIYSDILSAGGWDSREEFLARCMDGWTIFDDAERAKAVKWIVDTYAEECLSYMLVDIEYCYAFCDDITVFPPFRVQMGYRYQDMRFGG